MKPGPKPGNYRHSPERKEKIRKAREGRVSDQQVRNRISETMLANNAGERCARRFEELRREYPGQQDFFDANREALISSLEDVRSEKELTKIRKHIELSRVEANLSYEYPSSSIYAVEDLLIDLLDFKRELFRKVEEMDKIVISG